MSKEYTECASELPPDSVIVATKIDDAKGCRNEGLLSRTGNLWFIPDGSMYVYYTPTHWRHATKAELKAERAEIADRARVNAEVSTRLLTHMDAAIARAESTAECPKTGGRSRLR